jgi:molecular chaperone DnaK
MYGIDLGTTNSVISIIEEGVPRVIENKNGNRITPSVVHFGSGIIVGEDAKKQYTMDPLHTILSIKRLMGTNEKIIIDGEEHTPEEISAKILRKLVDDANERTGLKINKAVITVPAYFDDRQRNSTKQAGEIAGIEVLRIINEPTAAALAYGLDKREEARTVCIYDLGGGTFDVSILTIGMDICEVHSTAGNTHLGGDDFDKKIQDWLVEMFLRDNQIDLSTEIYAMSRIREESENAKKALSNATQVDILIPFIIQGPNGPLNLKYNLTQTEFGKMIADDITKTIICTQNALNDAKIKPHEISEIILVGGSTRVPMVQEAIMNLFGKTPNKTVNPDEVVSVGAAISAAIIGGTIDSVILADITPLTLSVEVKNGLSDPMIPRNTTIPTTHKQIYTTAVDGQDSVEVHITQGERALAKENRSLGKFKLDGILPAPAGEPKIEVKFDIDVNGILSVAAKDVVTGKEKAVTIENGESLTPEELQKMVDEGKKYAEEDRNKRILLEHVNMAERLIENTRKLLNEHRDRLPEDIVECIESALEATEGNLDVQNPSVISESIKALQQDSLKIGQYIYNQ